MRTLATFWLVFLATLMLVGNDEFGRNIGFTTLQALAISGIKGGVIGAIVMGVAIAFAYLVFRFRLEAVERTLGFIADLFDTAPSLIWILVVVVVIPQPRQLVPLIAFGLIAIPSITRAVTSEVLRVSQLDYVTAARCIGVSEPRILFVHIFPNAGNVLIPLTLQIVGSAVAIDGAIGLLGVGNRSDLNLGTFLIRGKEQFLFAPQLFLISLAAYLVLFATLFHFIKRRR